MTPTIQAQPLLAAAVAVLVACQASESAPDAALPPPTEDVTLIFDPEFSGMLVFSSEPSGELMDSGTVSANGKASLRARPGGMVSLAPGGAQLISILNIDPSIDIVWETAARPAPAARSLSIASSANLGADRYYIAACQDAALESDEPFSTMLRLDSSCVAEPSVTVMSFATGMAGLLAYEHASLSVADELELVHEIEWQTSFEEVPFEPVLPGLTYFANVSPKLKFDDLTIEMPPQEFSLEEPMYLKPPAVAELLWMRITAFGGGRGWQEFAGPLATAPGDWLTVPNGMVIFHTSEVDPEVRWLPTGQGEYQSLFCFWEVESEYGFWQFIAAPDENFAVYPELPMELQGTMLLGLAPSSPTTGMLEVLDYGDIDGYAAATTAGRISWAISPGLRNQHLDGGETIAIATTFSD